MPWFVAISGIVQLMIAAGALSIGLKALRVSERVQMEATLQRDRMLAYDRMMQTHTALNEVGPLLAARQSSDGEAYRERQQWLRTMLTVAGLRGRLPFTESLSACDIVASEDEIARLIRQARDELIEELEHQADRFYGFERLS